MIRPMQPQRTIPAKSATPLKPLQTKPATPATLATPATPAGLQRHRAKHSGYTENE